MVNKTIALCVLDDKDKLQKISKKLNIKDDFNIESSMFETSGLIFKHEIVPMIKEELINMINNCTEEDIQKLVED